MTDQNPNTEKGQPGLAEAALFGCCPACGARTLFRGPITFADRCRVCGLDFSRFNVGDGPAALVTLVAGAILVGLALWLEVSVAPPFWVHIILWGPLTIILVLAGLRFTKGFLLAAEYRNKAGEAGRKDP